MKIGFDRLKNKYKLLLIIISSVLSFSLVITAFCINNDYIKILLGSIALIILVFLFFFLIWYFMYKEKFSNKDKYKNINKNQPVDIIIEYPKVVDEHYLRYVYIEGLTLADNLDKLSLSEDDFTYVDDVDNKYDNEALALFYKNFKIGYFYKNGRFRELFRKYRNNKDYKIITKVCHLDLINNKIKLKIAFYKTLESENFNKINISIENKDYNYLKVGYWLNVNQYENAIGKKEYQIEDIYGKRLAIIENEALDNFNNNCYGKIISIDKEIELVIYHISK